MGKNGLRAAPPLRASPRVKARVHSFCVDSMQVPGPLVVRGQASVPPGKEFTVWKKHWGTHCGFLSVSSALAKESHFPPFLGEGAAIILGL